MHTWKRALLIGVIALVPACGRTPPQEPAPARGRWQVTTFSPSEDTDVDGAILLDTFTGDSYVLCDYATAWCKLDRREHSGQ